jgi:hypothetical protein
VVEVAYGEPELVRRISDVLDWYYAESLGVWSDGLCLGAKRPKTPQVTIVSPNAMPVI